jgi:diguanylate cyclase (GGDEF)-like protein
MSPRRPPWLVVAVVIMLAGVVISVFSAQMIVRYDVQRSHQSASASAVEIASTLKLALHQEQDLATSAAALVIITPGLTQAQFVHWVKASNLFDRNPEVLGIAVVNLVSNDQLAAFAARAVTDPVGYLGPHGTFEVVPGGSRPYYCLESAAVGAPGQPNTPAGLDLCASGLGPALLRARSSGQGAYVPYSLGTGQSLAVGMPIYATGSVPTTEQGRLANFVGWTGTQLQPATLLKTAVHGHPDTAVTFAYRDGPFHATFHYGSAPDGAATTKVTLHNGWTVTVASAPIPAGIWANPNACLFLLGGLLLALLAAILAYVLGTSRSRAVMMVHERTDQLRHLALHDALTDLPNRSLILDRIGQMTARARRQRTPIAVLFIDLDNFKDINDTIGHRAGDELLQAVGARLASLIREGDTAGRLGGDEFVILTEGSEVWGGTELVADRILDAMDEPFEIESSDTPLVISASIGIAEGARDTPEELLQDADIALYQAKAAGKHCALRFSPSMQAAVDDHRRLELDLQVALERDELFLVYQPTVALSTGVFNGVEALIRWKHPTRGVVMPDDFIPELESSGQIVPVGAWILHTACRQVALWRERGYHFTVSVNVSARQLDDPGLLDDVQEALQLSGLDPSSLVLELTETALMRDVGDTIVKLRALKELGIRIAVDDFGTGFSSLAYLRQFPIDILKIDRSFVAAIAESAESAALVHTLVELGKLLHIETMAEGVETCDQWHLLDADRVDTGQGYLFSRPLGVDALDELLERSSGTPLVPLFSKE